MRSPGAGPLGGGDAVSSGAQQFIRAVVGSAPTSTLGPEGNKTLTSGQWLNVFKYKLTSFTWLQALNKDDVFRLYNQQKNLAGSQGRE